MPKILFIVTHRLDRSPTQRFRFEQYLSYLKGHQFDCDISYIIQEKDDKTFYSQGRYLSKFWILCKAFFIRCKDVLKASSYDIIFIEREAFLGGIIWFEKLFKKSGAKLVFDFDDAIWNMDVSEGNKKFKFLKRPSKTSDLIALSDLVFAGNEYLRDYALPHNKSVVIIPTTIDTQEYQKIPKDNKSITIGWSGSFTTIKHFEFAIPFLRVIKKKYPDVEIKVIGDGSYRQEELGIKGLPWSKKDEIAELSSFDIGIMPLPDDEWSKGKCGLKGLQYMALGIPTVMSPVGVNTQIIQHGINGFLAKDTEEWVHVISQLIEDHILREKIGDSARQTVIQKYSVEANKDLYVNNFNSLLKK